MSTQPGILQLQMVISGAGKCNMRRGKAELICIVTLILVKMLHLLLILLHLFCSGAVHAETKPSNVTIIEPTFIRYCPFRVNVSLATDLSSLDIAFLTKSANPGPPPLGVHRCYVRVQIGFDKTVYAYTINEVEYVPENAKSITGKIETRVAWEYDSGPTQFTAVTLSSTSGAQTAKNITYARGAGCQDDPFLNILASFNENELQWRTRSSESDWFADKFCIQYGDCRNVDVDGLPSWPESCTFPNGTV
ncbi:uncharacterized protein BDR25DRAFT_355681 [Lindgomyces ingoldianus]|uniref:Uncharacterized protein n=1 Tax=Lindgomyces ingoldianus TaxID=673940 RepID=A0ACB6QSG2_9PLEO|nr:uncharacterized protein BDR25DRAFT_355681 [Lindgomyces ingoldianus]KAF2469954.1 hypothetical protein BDR25DRAFT_355681 [Lindgomyces ingoldianus]